MNTKISTVGGVMNFPVGVTVAPDGTVYAIDVMKPVIVKVANGISTELCGSSAFVSPSYTGYGYVDGQGATARINNPTAICSDNQGNVYLADNGNFRIRKITPQGNVTTVAGSGTSGLMDGFATSAQFKSMQGICIDSQGTIYVTDGNRIRKIANGTVTTVAGTFKTPKGITTDVAGNIYVCDSGNLAIKKIAVDGTITVLSTNCSMPNGICIDANGNLYISDGVENIVKKRTVDGLVTTWAGNGIGRYRDGICNPTRTGASLYAPEQIAMDAIGNIAVADRNSQVIRKIEIIL